MEIEVILKYQSLIINLIVLYLYYKLIPITPDENTS